MVGDGAYGVGFEILNTSSFDQQEVDFALALIQIRRKYSGNGVIAVDCGANVGVHTIEWARCMFAWGEVYSFEAQEKIFYALAGNIAINNCLNVHARHCAIGRSVGTLNVPEPDYCIPSSFGSFELIKKESTEFIGQEINYSKTREIPMVTIDSLGLSRLDFMKIDVEGMEEDVLVGAQSSISKNKPVMMMEHIKSSSDNLRRFLEERDYAIFLMGINILAVHKSDPVLKHVSVKNDSLSLSGVA